MNSFVTSLSLISIFICASDCVDFCDVKTMENVWNVGDFVYITRCGELWTFDPKLRHGMGDFIRDYSWYAFARNNFGQNIANEKNGAFDNKYLHFAAFSFNELDCEDWWSDLLKDCQESIRSWNGLSVIADNQKAVTFKFHSEIIFTNDSNNPLGFPAVQDLNKGRLPFWPKPRVLLPGFVWKEVTLIHSALFSSEENRLFMALLSSDKRLYCITHLNMKEMLYDVSQWPKRKENDTVYNWAPPFCFKGNVVGMFYKDGEAYVVGRVLLMNRRYEDQVYSMTAEDNRMVDINVVNIPGYTHPHNLRTFFGCDTPERFRIFTTTTGEPTTTTTTTESPLNISSTVGPKTKRTKSFAIPGGGARPPQFSRITKAPIPRPKRSPKKFGPIWTDIQMELRNDWILLSLMSVTALFMVYIIFRLKSN